MNQDIQKGGTFDIILSVGKACRSSHYLREHDLMFCANPLSWMTINSLDSVIHLYKTEFSDFFVDFVKDEQRSLEQNCSCFIDIKNNIETMHYEILGINHTEFRAKMVARFQKINRILLHANKICFISSRIESIDVFKIFLEKMAELYSGNITYINIRKNTDIDNTSLIKHYKEKISDKLELIEYEFYDVHPQGDDLKINSNAWMGNYAIWNHIMKRISLTNNNSSL